MPTQRQLFLQHVAQTSRMPLMLEVERAEGIYIYNTAGKEYIDFNSGICVSSLGHCHPAVVAAVQQQAGKHMHTMVYGEHIQNTQVALATQLCNALPEDLDSVYFVNSGSEAVEGAMKLAKRFTGRYEIIACRNAYHGSTQGAESLRSDRTLTSAFRPLIPGIRHLDFNSVPGLEQITNKTAAFIVEPVQAESGVRPATREFLENAKKRCQEVGALFILDEIQTGFGRTGKLFAFQHDDVNPDILLIAKGMGGGMPIGAFISSAEIMGTLTKNPALGHITTFGGHPVSCAAALACLNTLLDSDLIREVDRKAALIKTHLDHPIVKEIRHSGLMMAVELTKKRYLKYVVNHAFASGVIVDWFLFHNQSFRVAPPLIITEKEILKACQILQQAFDYALSQ